VSRGEPLAYFGSGGRLEVAVREGSAAHALGAVIGTSITLRTFTE
jgi:S-adenosylmethionine hydrolase